MFVKCCKKKCLVDSKCKKTTNSYFDYQPNIIVKIYVLTFKCEKCSVI